jgi:hypothetical protein
VIEELLKFLIGEVDTQLLKAVILRFVSILETGNQQVENWLMNKNTAEFSALRIQFK